MVCVGRVVGEGRQEIRLTGQQGTESGLVEHKQTKDTERLHSKIERNCTENTFKILKTFHIFSKECTLRTLMV